MKITIPSPCTQDFEEMSPGQSGSFCNSCGKEVIDFTSFTQQELIRYLKNKPSGLCGRFVAHQLNTYIPNTNTSFRGGAKWFTGLAASLTLFTTSLAKDKVKPETYISVPEKATEQGNDQLQVEKGSYMIKGKLEDKADGTPIVGATVQIKGTSLKTVSNAKGEFKLILKGDIDRSKLEIVFSYLGYKRETVPLKKFKGGTVSLLRMEMESIIMGGISLAE